ncbi:MAG TPA: biotin/lipoyl-containing protein [Solirubrobacteraceae bacterium]|nr:biotin/lipoyl-containing protein [Solirubrobacteraceae bacterium]
MALTHDEVREILDIIDSSAPGEIQVRTEGFSLHVVIGDGVRSTAAPEVPVPTVADAGPTPPTDRLETIESPMLGTFYRAESPGADPFVDVGSVVEPDTVVCIIEVMKMMNSVTAGVAGRVAEVVPENGQLVEFGEPLLRVEPA